MNPADVDRRHIVLAPGPRPHPRQLGPRLASVLEVALPDITSALRYGGGWIAQGVLTAVADEVVEIVKEEGFECWAVPDDGPPSSAVVRDVRSVVVDETAIDFDTRHGEERIPFEEIGCLDLVLLGKLTASPENLSKWEEHRSRRRRRNRDALPTAPDPLSGMGGALPKSLSPYGEFREALQSVELDDARPLFFVATREPVEFYRIEPGTRFPVQGLIGDTNAMDNFLRFVDTCLDGLPAGRALPETRTAWETLDLEPILMHKREELERRLTWLGELLARDLWEDFR